VAQKLLRGWITRLERYRDPESGEPGQEDPSWERDLSLYLLQGAAIGMPLTSEEAREIQKFLDRAVEVYAEFPNWDLWDPSVPDGAYDFRSGFQPERRPDATRVEELTMLLEYCWSPFKNPAGAEFVDCDVVRDPARWGESP
jgi:Uma2 family endonuclease